jgi:ATP phosphoribosyltransferase regulatory subunit
VFKHAPPQVTDALASLNALVERLERDLPEQKLFFDLAELSGYSYYTGAVFSAFVPGHGRAIAKGGRYNGIGRAFGRDRPATGFSADLKQLLQLSDVSSKMPGGILAPDAADSDLSEKIDALRAGGERVVKLLPGQSDTASTGCDRMLVKEKNSWIVKPI